MHACLIQCRVNTSASGTGKVVMAGLLQISASKNAWLSTVAPQACKVLAGLAFEVQAAQDSYSVAGMWMAGRSRLVTAC